MEDGNRKRKKPSGCCNSRTARRVSENTDCNCVQFRVYLKAANAPDSGSFRAELRHFSLKYEKYSCGKMSCPARKSLAAGYAVGFQMHPDRETSETQVFSLSFLKLTEVNFTLNTSSIKNFDELPLFLNAQLVSRTLGVSPSSAYELLHEDGFPSLRIGSRLVVPKEQFRLWVERQTGGAHEE